MTIYELLNSSLEKRKIIYVNSTDDELKSFYNELPFFEDHDNFKRVEQELQIFYDFTIKPIKIQSTL